MRGDQRWWRRRWTQGDSGEWMQWLERARKLDMKRMFNDAKRCWDDDDTMGTFCCIKWGGDEVEYKDKVVDRECGGQTGRSWCRLKGTKEAYSWWKYRATKMNGPWDIAWSISSCPKTIKAPISPQPRDGIGRLSTRSEATMDASNLRRFRSDTREDDWDRTITMMGVAVEWWQTGMPSGETLWIG